MKRLPTTGTGALLETLSPYVPDELINALLVQKPGPGRPASFSSAQLFGVLLLTLLTPVHSFNLLVELLPEQRAWRSFARLRNRHELPDVRMLHEFRLRLDLAKLRTVNAALLRPLLAGTRSLAQTVALIDSTDLPAATNAYKNTAGQYSARGATVGGRSCNDGQSGWYIGYKKHTLPLWLAQYSSSVILAPLVSWAAPANRRDALFLEPSICYCARVLEWTPDIVVGDMAYISLATQRRLREEFQVAMLTKFRPDMILPEAFDDSATMTCDQGHRMDWLGLNELEQL